MIEIECKRCHAKHHPRMLGRRLECSCTMRCGEPTILVAEFSDSSTNRHWFTVSSRAIVRVLA